MPYPNYHSARVKNPSLFQNESIRTKKLPTSIGGKGGVLLKVGRLKGQTTTTEQAYWFPKDLYTVAEAKKWLTDNKIKYISFEAASGK